MHVPLEQKWSAMQSSFDAHRETQAVAPQTYGAQVEVTPVGHAPWPSQLSAELEIPPLQVAPRQATAEPG